MQIALTLSSICYVSLSFTKTLYGIWLTKEQEERSLTREGVNYVWLTYVKDLKASSRWGNDQKEEAKLRVIEYVHGNEICFGKCCRVRDARLIDWIREEVALQKGSQLLYRRKSRRGDDLELQLL